MSFLQFTINGDDSNISVCSLFGLDRHDTTDFHDPQTRDSLDGDDRTHHTGEDGEEEDATVRPEDRQVHSHDDEALQQVLKAIAHGQEHFDALGQDVLDRVTDEVTVKNFLVTMFFKDDVKGSGGELQASLSLPLRELLRAVQERRLLEGIKQKRLNNSLKSVFSKFLAKSGLRLSSLPGAKMLAKVNERDMERYMKSDMLGHIVSREARAPHELEQYCLTSFNHSFDRNVGRWIAKFRRAAHEAGRTSAEWRLPKKLLPNIKISLTPLDIGKAVGDFFSRFASL